MHSKHFTCSGFKQNDAKLNDFKADPTRLSTDSFSAISILAHLIMQTSLIYYTQDFSVRWARDQPMPGPFPAPLPSQGKGPGNEVRFTVYIHVMSN